MSDRAERARRKAEAEARRHRERQVHLAAVSWASRTADAREVDGDRAGAWRIDERDAPTPRQYIAAVRRWMRSVRRLVVGLLRAALPSTSTTSDAEEDDEAQRAALAAAARALRESLRRARLPAPPLRAIEGAVQSAAERSMRRSRRAMVSAGAPRVGLASRLGVDLEMLTGIDIAPSAAEQLVIQAWAKQGTDLIRSVGQDLVEGLDEHIAEVARTGRLTSDLRRTVMDRLGVAERHAQFIARDQIAKLNGKITQATQQAAGVTSYRWRSSRDERVREAHRDLDGTVQRWTEPPVVDPRTGRREHPGGDYQCRCVAIPVVDWA